MKVVQVGVKKNIELVNESEMEQNTQIFWSKSIEKCEEIEQGFKIARGTKTLASYVKRLK